MEKYFMQGVDTPLDFGDTIGFTINEVTDDGDKEKNVEVEFVPEIVPLLLELGVITKKEVDEDKEDEAEPDEKEEEEEGDDKDYILECLTCSLEVLKKQREWMEELSDSLKDLGKRVEKLEEHKGYDIAATPTNIYPDSLLGYTITAADLKKNGHINVYDVWF